LIDDIQTDVQSRLKLVKFACFFVRAATAINFFGLIV
jgi:hypothetical protein